jgi:hypothetical protein
LFSLYTIAHAINVSFNNNNISESTIRPYNDAGTHSSNFEDTEGDPSGKTLKSNIDMKITKDKM